MAKTNKNLHQKSRTQQTTSMTAQPCQKSAHLSLKTTMSWQKLNYDRPMPQFCTLVIHNCPNRATRAEILPESWQNRQKRAKTRQRQYTLCRNWAKQTKKSKKSKKCKNDCSAIVLRLFCECSAGVLRVFCGCFAGVLRVSFCIFHVFNCFSFFWVVHSYSKQF